MLIPALDILQSVPVLGFLAVTVTFFTALFPGSELGLECAAIFAVFTSQAWNITFSFYHSLVSQAPEFNEASKLMGLSQWKRFWTVDVPSGAIGLVWNGMMSFGGSWFFLTASELIPVNNHKYTLPGVGSYVGVAVTEGKLSYVVYGIITMIIMILVVNFFFWRPLVAYVDKFRVEQSESELKAKSLVLNALRRSSWPAAIGRGKRALAEPVNRVMAAATGIDDESLASHAARRRAGDLAFTVVVAVALGYGLYTMLAFVATGSQGLAVFGTAFGYGFLTFLRVVVVVVAATLIWVPVGVWIGFNPRVAQFMQPIVQVLASFPANFIFPFAIVIFLDHRPLAELRRDRPDGTGHAVVRAVQCHRRRERGALGPQGSHGQPGRAWPGPMAAAHRARHLPRLCHRRDHGGRRRLECHDRGRDRHLQPQDVRGQGPGQLHRR